MADVGGWAELGLQVLGSWGLRNKVLKLRQEAERAGEMGTED